MGGENKAFNTNTKRQTGGPRDGKTQALIPPEAQLIGASGAGCGDGSATAANDLATIVFRTHAEAGAKAGTARVSSVIADMAGATSSARKNKEMERHLKAITRS
jgi:hypothetical protein